MTIQVAVLPHSGEIEACVLASMMTSVDALNAYCEMLTVPDFYGTNHQIIFSAVQSLYRKDLAVDINTLTEELLSSKDLERLGGTNAIFNIQSQYNPHLHLEDNIKILKDKSLLRKLWRITRETSEAILNLNTDAVKMVENLEKEIFNLEKTNVLRTSRTLKELLTEPSKDDGLTFLQRVQERQEMALKGAIPIEGYPTHYLDLDRLILGLKNSHFMIIGARPSVGKTTFALNLIHQLMMKCNLPVGLFSLEMPAEHIIEKLVCMHANVNAQSLSLGKVPPGLAFQNINVAIKELEQKQLLVDDQAGLTLPQLRSRIRRWKEVNGVKIIFIDYLQLVRGGGRFESKENEVAEISQTMKILAKELKIPIICLAQLNREAEKRTDKEPLLSDLRQSGSLEQDADEVLLLHRPDITDSTIKPGVFQVFVAKNRFGPTGKIELSFMKESGLIASLHKEEKNEVAKEFEYWTPRK